MRELITVFDEYLEKYHLNVVNAARIAILLAGLFISLFVRGKGRGAVVFTALLAFTLTFLPEMISLCRLLIKESK